MPGFCPRAVGQPKARSPRSGVRWPPRSAHGAAGSPTDLDFL